MKTTFALAFACLLTVASVFPGGEAKAARPAATASYGWGSWQPAYQASRSRGRTYARSAPRRATVREESRSTGNLVASNGKSAHVSATALPHFRCLVAWLEGAGYRINAMTGYAARPGNPSAHPSGNALDVNQTGFGRVSHAFPAGVDHAARACGLTPGSSFGDNGHFEMPGKYGYVFPAGWRARSRYARR